MPLHIILALALTLAIIGFLIFRSSLRYNRGQELFNFNEQRNTKTIQTRIAQGKSDLSAHREELENKLDTTQQEINTIDNTNE